MKKYHKIQTIFHRDQDTKFKTLIMGKFSSREFEYLYKNLWRFDEKADGTNTRLIPSPWDDRINFHGKDEKSELHPDYVKFLESRYGSKEFYDNFKSVFPKSNDKICLYGEGIGPKIQGNPYKMKDYDFILFDIKVGDWWLTRENIENIAKGFGITMTTEPIVGGIGTLEEMVKLVRKGFDSKFGPCTAEGIVARPLVELQSRGGERIITKLKHKDFSPEERGK